MSQDQLPTMLSTLGMSHHQQGIIRVERRQRPLRLEGAAGRRRDPGHQYVAVLFDTHDEERAEIQEEIEDLRDDIDHLRSEMAQREKKINHYETRLQHAQETLSQLDG
jgi:chromosome segregation ATPase